MELPAGLRRLGCGVAAAATGYYVWVQWALGGNFSPLLRIKKEQTLVCEGPYAKGEALYTKKDEDRRPHGDL